MRHTFLSIITLCSLVSCFFSSCNDTATDTASYLIVGHHSIITHVEPYFHFYKSPIVTSQNDSLYAPHFVLFGNCSATGVEEKENYDSPIALIDMALVTDSPEPSAMRLLITEQGADPNEWQKNSVKATVYYIPSGQVSDIYENVSAIEKYVLSSGEMNYKCLGATYEVQVRGKTADGTLVEALYKGEANPIRH